MSKIGKQPIAIPSEVSVEILGTGAITFTGKKGSVTVPPLRGVKPVLDGSTLSFELVNKTKQGRSGWGTFRALAANAITGLTKGFEKTLILEGIGFRMAKEGDGLTMNLGFSHPVKYPAQDGILFEVEKNTILKVSGYDRAKVGQAAAEIRSLKKPEPYKGKGFRYADEVITRKAGKKAAAAS